jgi:hypothetical protein
MIKEIKTLHNKWCWNYEVQFVTYPVSTNKLASITVKLRCHFTKKVALKNILDKEKSNLRKAFYAIFK